MSLNPVEHLSWIWKSLEDRASEIDEKITEKLVKIIQNERKITTRELTRRLNVSEGTVETLLSATGIRKLCSRFVPRFLTAEMQARRVDCHAVKRI